MKKLGLIVNPIAGIGGRVGLKGSDGPEIITDARQRGAVPESPDRALEALRIIAESGEVFDLFTFPGEMGENESRRCGLCPNVLGFVSHGETTAEDTRNAAVEMRDIGVDLLLFAGGDGTASDIFEAVGLRVPVLGIPAGVKIYSSVYAINPQRAGELAVSFLLGNISRTLDAEVMDIDEKAFRQGVVNSTLRGYLRVPIESRLVQAAKAGSQASEEEDVLGIASSIAPEVAKDGLYIIGPGTTTRAVMDKLGMDSTLLGVDAVWNGSLVGTDLAEQEILSLIQKSPAKILVSVIGGQGYVLGRGNRQLSPAVLKKIGTDNIMVLAAKEKLASLNGRPLLVDTGDLDLDRALTGYVRVTTGFSEQTMYRIDC